MCDTILINGGEIEVESVRQFREHFNVPLDEDKDLTDDECLCHVDIPAELKKLGIEFTYDAGWYLIEQDMKKDIEL